MNYIQFDKSKLPNLEYSLFKEIVRTNRSGAYLSTSILGCNTRKYHGLLVCPIEKFGGESYVLLSSMQCSVIQNEKIFNLAIQEYKGDYFEPKGHKYMYDYAASPTTKLTHRVGGVILTQEFILASNENQILIKYTLEDTHDSDVTIRLKPFLAFRSIHELTHENMALNTHYTEVKNGVKFQPYAALPELYIQASKAVDYIAMPDWYRNVEYIKERYRGYDYTEDLYVPGYFEFKIKKGESVVMSAALFDTPTTGLKTKFSNEVKRRTPKDNMLHFLMNAGQQFIERKDNLVMLKAGYHWKKPQLRDMFISLAGLAMHQEDKKTYIEILDDSIANLRRFYIDEAAQNNTSIDVPLWFFYCVNELERFTPRYIDVKKYFTIMNDLLEHYWSGVPGKMHRQDNGLLYARNEGEPQTWMNAKRHDGYIVSPRYGCTVEVNALWYNAIATSIDVANKIGNKTFINEWLPRLDMVGKSFIETFVNPDGSLYDRVDCDYCSPHIRPNMLIAAGLKYTPLSREQKKHILDITTRELLTPRGIRSLSPNDEHYTPNIEGDENARAMVLHNGPAYPWLLSFYGDLLIELHRNSGISQIKKIIATWEPELQEHGIGTISERYNGNPPYQAKGAISMAWNVAALLKLIKLTETK